jgi:hypothetical protein
MAFIGQQGGIAGLGGPFVVCVVVGRALVLGRRLAEFFGLEQHLGQQEVDTRRIGIGRE